jgi:hypothetical protein
MERGRKSIAQLARELEPLPSGWSEMNIQEAMHLLHLPAALSVTNAGLREALENALERAKFDEIPVLLGAYRILDGHFGGPEGAATRQDDPTSASWPAAAAGFAAVKLEAWEDDPSITVSDIRMIEPASIAAPSIAAASPAKRGVTAANSSLQALGSGFEPGTNPERILIDDFNLGQLNVQAVAAQRMPKVIKIQSANGRITRARRISIPAVLALGISSLLVVWAYHPFAQGLVSSLFGQTPQPVSAAEVPLANATVTASSEVLTPTSESKPSQSTPDQSTPGVVSSESVMQAPKTSMPQASTVNDQPNSGEQNLGEQNLGKVNVKAQTSEPLASQSNSNKALLGQPVPNKPGLDKPSSSMTSARVATGAASAKAALPKATSPKAALPKAASPKIVSAKTGSASTARKGNSQPKPSVIAARQPKPTASRGIQATARQPRVVKPRVVKPQVIRTRPVKTQPLIGSQTTKKALQAVTNVVTQVPRGTTGKPLRASRQADAGRTTRNGTNANSSTKPKSANLKSTSNNPNVDTSITNPIKLASSNERDAAATRAIANPQPVARIQTPKASGRIDNLSREEFGQRYFNRKLFEVWQRDGAKLRYGNWEEVPLELQILENNLFRSAIYLNGPGGNEAKDNEKPLRP